MYGVWESRIYRDVWVWAQRAEGLSRVIFGAYLGLVLIGLGVLSVGFLFLVRLWVLSSKGPMPLHEVFGLKRR